LAASAARFKQRAVASFAVGLHWGIVGHYFHSGPVLHGLLVTLELTAISADQEAECERQVFDPTRVTDGIELSADLILNFRPLAYDVSIRRRLKLAED